LNSLHFGVASFFIRGLCFEPMNEGSHNALSFMALAYLAHQLLSNTELELLVIIASGLHGLHLIKNLILSRASPMRKRGGALRK
jgi:hypothetical protein